MSKFFSFIAVVALVVLAFVGVAIAGDGATSTSQVLRARVALNGSIVNGTEGASSQRLSSGIYVVRFPKEIGACVVSATRYSKKDAATPSDPGSISIQPRSSNAKEVLVLTYSSGGSRSDHGFDLLVACTEVVVV